MTTTPALDAFNGIVGEMTVDHPTGVETFSMYPMDKEDVELVRTALANAPQWLPIETAPKDGTIVDLWTSEHGGARVSDAKFDEGKWCTFRHEEEDRLGDGWWPVYLLTFTHWMPLPQPPKGE